MDLKENKAVSRQLIDALYELSRENFNVSDDTILDKLYVHIEKSADGNDFSELIRDFAVWLESVLKQWTSNMICGGVKVLSIRLIGLVGSKPHGFTTVKHMLPEVEKLMSTLEVQNDSSLMVPLINNLLLFLNHDEGFNWVLNSEIWKHAIKSFYGNHSIYTNRSGVKFISVLLTKLDKRSHKIVDILNVVCGPLVDNSLLTINPLPKLEKNCVPPVIKNSDRKCIVSELEKTTQQENQTRAAKYIRNILDEIVSSKSYLPVEFDYHIPNDISSAYSASPQDIQLFHQMVVLMQLNNTCSLNMPEEGGDFSYQCSYSVAGDSIEISLCPLEPAYIAVLQALHSFMSLGHVNSVMDFCVFCLRQISHFREAVVHNHVKCYQCEEIENILVNQLKMFLELHFTCFCVEDPLLKSTNPVDMNGIINFLSEETKEINNKEKCEGIIKHLDENIVNKFKGVILDKTMSIYYFHQGISACIRSVNLLFYASSKIGLLTLVARCLESSIKHYSLEKDRMSLILINLMSLTSKLIVERKIEPSICQQLVESIYFILDMETDTRVVVSTLQFLNKLLATQLVSEFITWPDFKLGYRHMQSLLPCIAVSLMKNLKNHSSWEIRDTTLEVYHEVVIEPRNSIPAIISMTSIKKNLFGQVRTLAATDSSAYVRSSALKFFSKVVRAKVCLYELSSKELSDLAIKTLMSDEMPGPRMAACDLLAAMYVTDFLLEEGMPGKLYEAVFTASMKDLDWEVKKATLRFWQCVITKELMNNGVPLLGQHYLLSNDNGEEVIVKVISVMEKLNDIGCFKVIWSDVTDESDISVSEEASHAVENILDLDRKWNFINRVIDDCYLEVDERNRTCKHLNMKEFFMNISQNDWQQKLEARKNWISNTCEDLKSLLDHILNPDSSTDWDHNAIDCY